MVWRWMWNLFHEGDRIFDIFTNAKHEWKYYKILSRERNKFHIQSQNIESFPLVFEHVSFKS